MERVSVIERYHRSVEPAAEDSLGRLVRWIDHGASVLDVGAATGSLGQFLSEHRHCVVDGVEIDLEAAAVARPHYRQMVVADLEAQALPELFPAATYDYIVLADVLEHLRDPRSVLESAIRLLAPGGHVLISIPNVGYAPLIAELLCGRFEYRNAGLLDRTHRWFFTRRSLKRLVEAAGLHIRTWDRVAKEPHQSEFGTQFIEALPPAVQSFLGALDTGGTYQFILDAVPAEAQTDPTDGTTSEECAHPVDVDGELTGQLRFVARLGWRFPGATYSPDTVSTAVGTIGSGLQTLHFTVPPMGRPPAAFRLAPADRETVIHLVSISVTSPDGALLWQWDGSHELLESAAKEGMIVGKQRPGSEGVPLALSGPDARLELPLAPDLIKAIVAQGAEIALHLSWPRSPEYMGILSKVADEFTELRDAEKRIQELVRSRDELLELLDSRLELLRQTEVQVQALTEDRERLGHLLEKRLQLLKELEAERERPA